MRRRPLFLEGGVGRGSAIFERMRRRGCGWLRRTPRPALPGWPALLRRRKLGNVRGLGPLGRRGELRLFVRALWLKRRPLRARCLQVRRGWALWTRSSLCSHGLRLRRGVLSGMLCRLDLHLGWLSGVRCPWRRLLNLRWLAGRPMLCVWRLSVWTGPAVLGWPAVCPGCLRLRRALLRAGLLRRFDLPSQLVAFLRHGRTKLRGLRSAQGRRLPGERHLCLRPGSAVQRRPAVHQRLVHLRHLLAKHQPLAAGRSAHGRAMAAMSEASRGVACTRARAPATASFSPSS